MNQLIFSHTQKLCCFTGHHIFIKNCWREENYTLVSAIWITPFLYKGTSHSNGMLWKPRWHLLRKKTSPQIRWTDKLAVQSFGYKWIGYLSASTFPSFAVSADRKDMISNSTYEEWVSKAAQSCPEITKTHRMILLWTHHAQNNVLQVVCQRR